MKYPFLKYSGAGNDFVTFDTRLDHPEPDAETVRRLCDRHFGIGADGVMWIAGHQGDAAFRMIYYNADGSRAEMCGNGARCLTAAAKRQWNIPSEGTFEADDGLHRYRFERDQVWVEILGEPVMESIDIEGRSGAVIDTGPPHLVLPIESFDVVDLDDLGASLNADPRFPRGTNTNFLVRDGSTIRVRTWERGVNAQTLACGTGATACAHYLASTTSQDWPCHMEFPGGRLTIDQRDNGYWLTGPTRLVFTGSIEPDLTGSSSRNIRGKPERMTG